MYKPTSPKKTGEFSINQGDIVTSFWQAERGWKSDSEKAGQAEVKQNPHVGGGSIHEENVGLACKILVRLWCRKVILTVRVRCKAPPLRGELKVCVGIVDSPTLPLTFPVLVGRKHKSQTCTLKQNTESPKEIKQSQSKASTLWTPTFTT